MNAVPCELITPPCEKRDASEQHSTSLHSGAPVRSTCPRTLDSRDVLGDQPVVLIQHLGTTYRLQSTRQGKLILTK